MHKIIDILLRHSAHVDAKNNSGDIAAKGLDIRLSQHTNLQCLAAAAVKKHQLAYEGIIPDSFIPFVHMH